MTPIARFSATISLAAAAAAMQPAWAEDDAAGATDYHAQQSGEIIVTAPIRRDRMDVLSGTSVLSGAQLTQAVRPSLGETLEHTAGVSATSFGPNASRPILRGMQGERVRVLTDGIGSVDVSNTSVDHAVVVNPLLAERIEVLRGPESLLYGSAAIGGVVNVIDKRIPRSVPDEAAHVDMTGGYGTAANERSLGGAIDVPVSAKLVVHADGSYLKTGDLDIGGHALTRDKRNEALASARLPVDPDNPIDFAGNAAIEGKLPNSAGKTWTAGAGIAYITDTGNFGLSYGHYDSLYGVPIRYATAPGEAQEAPRLDIVQNRLDFRGEIDTGGGLFQTIRVRSAFAHYRHFELEQDGSVATAFYNDGYEARVEAVQTDRGAWKGVIGAQLFARDFNVVGDEAFLPKNSTDQIGLFTLQQLDYGKLKIEGGARYERTSVKALPLEDQPQFFAGSRSFDTVSASVGASYGLTDQLRVGANLLHTVRAPAAEELFANGPHGGTEAFEVGDPGFRTERSNGVEAVLHGKGSGFTFDASVYHNWFDNFIYDTRTGAIEDGLPVYRFLQAKARYYGIEAQGTVDLATIGDYRISADALGDYVHARIIGNGPAPRIPPLRLLGGVEANSDRFGGRVEVEWSAKQDRVASFETPTEGFTLVNASLTVHPLADHPTTTVVLSANNIFDVNARRAASYLKDYAPLSGRDFRITTRLSF